MIPPQTPVINETVSGDVTSEVPSRRTHSGRHDRIYHHQMIRHCVLLRFAAEVSNSDKDALFERLASLQSVVPGFERIVYGVNSSTERVSQGFDDGFVIEFVDASARDTYLAHPDHQRAGAALVAMLDGGHEGLVVFDLDDDVRRVPPAASTAR
ncbi:MAG: Dabb family protein [Acidobacteriota bacterium]